MVLGQRTTISLVLAGITYAAIGFLLYRQRSISDSAIWDSDTLTFLAPALLAFTINTFIVTKYARPLRRFGTAAAIALLATGFAYWFYMMVAINTYGA